MKKLWVCFLVVILTGNLMARSVNFELFAKQLVKDFEQKKTFSMISGYFVNINDYDTILQYIRNNIFDPKHPICIQLIKISQKADYRHKEISRLRRSLRSWRNSWNSQQMYPVDTGSKVKLKNIALEIEYFPFKHYTMKIRGHYLCRGKRVRLYLRMQLIILNGIIRIAKYY